jgi:pimeloyl-ACP methyl ester carboxylesterase
VFFGAPSAALFGVFHEPARRAADGVAVVLCPPAPQQYMLTHWAHRRLAALVADAGLPVLRFDYFGTGDSAGDVEDGTLEAWERNVGEARAAARALAGADRTSLVGHGLGAVLAWRAARADGDRPRDLVLWDPVVRGPAYLEALTAAERAFASRLLHFPDLGAPPRELGGHTMSPAQRAATESVDLLTEPPPAAARVHLYAGAETPGVTALAERLGREVRRFTYEHVPDEGAREGRHRLSHRVVQTIARAVAPRAA